MDAENKRGPGLPLRMPGLAALHAHLLSEDHEQVKHTVIRPEKWSTRLA